MEEIQQEVVKEMVQVQLEFGVEMLQAVKVYSVAMSHKLCFLICK